MAVKTRGIKIIVEADGKPKPAEFSETSVVVKTWN